MAKLTRRQAIAAGAAAILGGPAALAKAKENRIRARLLEYYLNSKLYNGWSCELRPNGQHGPILVFSGGNRSGGTCAYLANSNVP